jgi:hypothetical protein
MTATCCICEAAVPPAEVVYSTEGNVQCPGCHKLAGWSAQIGRAAESAKAEGASYFSGRPPVVHPVTACAACSAAITSREGFYSVKAWKATGKPKVLCAKCDKAELDEMEAKAKADERQAVITLGVVAGIGLVGGLIYWFLIR